MAIPVLSGISDALNFYQRHVTDPIAGTGLLGLNRLKQGLGLGDPGSDYLSQQFGDGMPGDGSDPTGALDYAFHDNPWGRFAVTAAADPLNYIGLGLPGLASKAVAKLGLSALPGVTGALDAAGALDKVPGAVGGKGLDLLGDATWNTVGKPLGSLLAGPVGDFTSAHPDLAANWLTANLAWKQLAHSIPGYHLQNLLDDASRAIGFGQGDGVLNAIKSKLGMIDDPGQKWYAAAGREPESVSTAAALGMGSNPESIFRSAGDMANRYYIDPAGNVTDTAKPLQQWLDTAPAPVKWGADRLRDLTEANMGVEGSLEHGLRSPVWGTQMDKLVASNTDHMGMSIPDYTNTLDASGYPGTAGALEGSGYALHPDEIKQLLQHEGMPATYADTYKDRFSDLLNQGWKGSNQGVDQALYNMRTPPGIANRPEEKFWRDLAQNTFGGYKFATQNVPAFVRLSTAHPGMMNVPTDYYRNSDLYNQTHGLPESYHGEMPMGNVGGNDLSINPFGFSSLVGLAGEMGDKSNEEDMSPLGQIAHSAGQLGLGLNPIINTALTATGQYGSQQEKPLFRALTPFSGLASLISGQPTDLEQPIKNAVGGVERGITGRQTFPFQDYLTRQRLVEQAGGDPMAVDAQGQQLADAQRSVANETGIKDLLSALGIPGYHVLTPEGKRIDMNQHLSQVYQAMNNPAAAATNPTAGATDLVDPINEQVYNFDTLPWLQQQQLLQDPIARQKILEQKSRLLHTGPGGYLTR